MTQTLEQAAETSALKKYPSFTAENYDLVMAIRKAYTIGFKAGAEWQKKQKPLEYLPKEKVYDIMSKLTNLSFSELFPINSEEYKKINEITSDIRDLLNYSIEQKNKDL